MPCKDSSSSLVIHLDADEKFKSYTYAKITCGQEIKEEAGLNQYFAGRALGDIVQIPFLQISNDLNAKNEESQFVLYLEWDALRCAIALFLGLEDKEIDTERCLITSIEYTDEGTEIAEVILPPKEMPKILPCSLADRR